MPGTFDLYLVRGRRRAPGGATPRNQRARLANGLTISGAGRCHPARRRRPVRAVSGTIGSTAFRPRRDRWRPAARNATGDAFTLTAADRASYAARVVPGTYDLYFAGTDGVFAIASQNARLASGIVVTPAGTTALDIDVPWATSRAPSTSTAPPPVRPTPRT